MDQEKGFFEGCEGKKAFLDHKKNGLQKTTKICIFSKGVSPWFLSKKLRFFNLYFLCKMDQEIVFFLRFRKKESLFRVKEHRLKKTTKICIFSKGLVDGLSKNGNFLIFSFLAK